MKLKIEKQEPSTIKLDSVTFPTPISIYRRIKKLAAEKGVPVGKLIESAIEQKDLA